MASNTYALTESEQMQFRKAIQLAGASRFDRAGNILKKLYEKNKSNDLISFNLANTYYMSKKYRSAASLYSQVFKRKGNLSIPAGIYLIRSQALLGKFKLARRVLLQLPRPELEGLGKEWDNSRDLLVEEIIVSGINSYEKSNYRAASLRFTLALRIDKKNPQALYLLGLSEKQRGESRRSEYFLKKALAQSSRSERLTINRIIGGLKSGQNKGTNVTVSTTMRSDSNYFREKTDSPQEAISLLHSVSASLFEKQANGAVYAGVISASLEDYFDVKEQDYGDIDLRAPISVPFELSDLIFTPKFYASWFDSLSYNIRPGFRIRFVHRFSEFSGGVEFSYDRTIPQSSEFSYQEGNNFRLKGFMFIPGSISILVNAGVRDTSSGDFESIGFTVPQAFVGPELSLRASTSFGKVNVSSGAEMTLFRYKSRYQPEDDVRTDRNISINTYVDFMLKDTIRVDLGIDYTSRDSSMVSSVGIDKNFVQWVYSLGLTWDLWL